MREKIERLLKNGIQYNRVYAKVDDGIEYAVVDWDGKRLLVTVEDLGGMDKVRRCLK